MSTTAPTNGPLPPAVTVYDVLDHLRGMATSKADKGALFERLARAWFKTDPMWIDQFDEVWLWPDWPGNGGQHDAGIDLVARNRAGGSLTAIQAKFYEASTPVSKADIDTFLSASGKSDFASRIVITTNDTWSHHAEAAIKDQHIPVQRIGLPDLEASRVDWSKFSLAEPEDLTLAPKKQAHPHQTEAIDAVLAGFGSTDRGQLIMACGTGKTLTSLRLAEKLVGAGGTVLYLVPSIALLSQSLREWVSDAEVLLAPLAVCSDPKSTKKAGALEDISIVDLALPATTNPATIRERLKDAVADDTRMTVVFSTYQSLDVVHQAVSDGDIDPFDLVLCDEAHRTTGVTLSGADESAFVKVHDAAYLPATRRLYLTATPKLYDDSVKAKAGDADAILASMDDEDIYGPEFHRLGFGQAVSLGLLTDYKVLVLAVDEASIAETFQERMANADNELALDDYAKLIGCWNGLSKRGESEHTFADDPAPMRRAVAFTSSIKDSQTLAGAFPTIVDEYIDTHDLDVIDDAAIAADGEVSDSVLEQAVIKTAVTHVDGTMSALERNAHIDWLKSGEADTCRILSNARCLSEGVDVPSLDAVMFLSSRKSVVDIVQAVGRVMRKADGKKYGYIILPVVIPAGKTPEEALADNKRYQVIWDVLQALRAHDEQFEATVNQIDLNKKRSNKIDVIGVSDKVPTDDTTPGPATEKPDQGDPERAVADQVQLTLELKWPELENLRDALYARIVKRVGKRRYWETWARDVARIAEAHITRINTLLDTDHDGVADDFETFLTGLRNTLNDSITRTDAVEMLAQHLITRPVFDALFEGYDFAAHNPVSQAMEKMLATLDKQNLDVENKTLDKFYDSVRTRATGITDAEGRQRIIVELYDTFFSTAFKRTVDKLGIVYTPIECVDFLLHSADWVLREEFGTSISAENVHVLDGFTGTGTFIVRLLQSGLIEPHDLARKFASELHANEFLLLAYYIAAVNIETAFHDQVREHAAVASYEPFDGLVLTDTFQAYETGDQQDLFVLPQNNERLKRQLDLPITVIVGNPPYSAGQGSANDNNANEKYPHLDQAIRDTYAARTGATNKNSLYDSYIRAIKWASLRLGERGVVAYITNGGWLDGNTAAGLRKCLVEEFSAVHVLNLKGNMRSSDWKREGGQIFGAGSQATVAMFLLVKNPDHAGPGVVHYRDIGDYLSRQDKLAIVADVGSFADIETQVITPNADGDWLDQRSADFPGFITLGDKADGAKGVIRIFSSGVKTARDSWVYNADSKSLEANVKRMLATYNEQRELLQTSPTTSPTNDTRLISWNRSLLADATRNAPIDYDPMSVTTAAYRPFFKQRLYFNRKLNDMVYRVPTLFPGPKLENRGFYLTGVGATKAFSALATDVPTDLNFWGSEGGQYFARWSWQPLTAGSGQLDFGDDSTGDAVVVDGYKRVDNITDHALEHFRAAYGESFTKDDIFAYCYGLLHSIDYRTRYAADLKKVLPRLPLVEDPAPYVVAGNTLLDLHINYEKADRYQLGGLDDLLAGQTDEAAYAHYAVEKLRYGKPTAEQKKAGERADKTTIVVNPRITLTGIPEAAHRYMLGSRSAVDWLLDRYQVKVEKASGIVNDPNDWAREVGDPRYIVDLIARVVTVSVKTVGVVDSLPALAVVVPDSA
jgi:predicted helicase